MILSSFKNWGISTKSLEHSPSFAYFIIYSFRDLSNYSKFMITGLCFYIIEPCINSWSVSIIPNNPGTMNIMWPPVPEESHLPGSTYKYLVSYKIATANQDSLTTIVTSSRTAVLDFLHPKTTYSIHLVALDMSVPRTIHSCEYQVQTRDGKEFPATL